MAQTPVSKKIRADNLYFIYYYSVKNHSQMRKVNPLNDTQEHTDGPPRKKKKNRGMNRQRPRDQRPDNSSKLCSFAARGEECTRGDSCFYGHDPQKFLETKEPDIGKECVNFLKSGKCPYGISCRYWKHHTTADLKSIINEEFFSHYKEDTSNNLAKDVQISLRKKKYMFPRSNAYLELLSNAQNVNTQTGVVRTHGCVTNEDLIKLRTQEKKRIDFSDKLYLAPLTTIGNLPFRRICKQYGADITCGEMAMCTNLLQGQQSEWALVKRHSSEDIFGVQLCGAFPDTMTKCAELLQKETDVDFIDINTGCPIDLVFNKGAGSALMERKGKLQQIVQGMKSVIDIPLTVKIRAGIHDKKYTWNAHKLVGNLRDWGTDMVTIHGRSREQRYTKSADWDYISEVAKLASPMPVFGNGDILSFEDAMQHRKQAGVAGVMIARGAIIKPWIFTEIKEQRHWDISSSERLDILRQFVNAGLEHWGSDTQGVEKTRRFLLEWLSFTCRYVPVGLLERLPQRINDRPPAYFGRNDLETLMASPNCEDWVKISEMLLGPVPTTFAFLPKHKANSYTETEG
ncbi:predicted protein [Nematostella vectensis]|uniref:tRNA-dihydrouridine(47) synthase [NAD(P)(+)] n=1 Tax=Nematostella vectensis TaxID=45351 RepID=A7S213_NEMVE|nr:predicted protein [Nematostella vectensis]|eukprot:XP_001634218.1 predicted protein [Nematostella vectensis]